MTTVPYKGTAPAMTDLIGGQVDLMCDQTTNTTSQIEGKKIKAFGVTTLKRLAVPAATRIYRRWTSRVMKGFDVTIWHGLYAPKGTPADVVVKAINDRLEDGAQGSRVHQEARRPGRCRGHDKTAWNRLNTRNSWWPKSPSGARSSRRLAVRRLIPERSTKPTKGCGIHGSRSLVCLWPGIPALSSGGGHRLNRQTCACASIPHQKEPPP
jgi:hypothetical protein